jgi:creatinine amidohydrolase
MMDAIIKQVSRAGFKVLVAHGHGPSTGFVRDNSAEWEKKYGIKILNCWGPSEGEGMGIMVDHAAMNETSLVMAMRPELVHMEYLPEDENVWPAGVGGKDPRIYASQEKGMKIISFQKDRMIEVIQKALQE